MMQDFIEEKVKEFDRNCLELVKDGGWNVPYEGIEEYKASLWLRTALTAVAIEVLKEVKEELPLSNAYQQGMFKLKVKDLLTRKQEDLLAKK